MPVDTSIYNAFLQPQKSSLDYANQFAQAQQLRNQNALSGLQLQQAASVNDQRTALRGAVQSGQLDLNDPNASSRALTMAPDVAPALLKTIQDQRTSSALAAKDTAQAGNFNADAGSTNFKTQVAKANQAITDISNLGTPADAIAGIQQHLKNGDIDLVKASSLINTLQPSLQDPAQFGQWKRQMVMGIMDAKDRIAATAPKVTMANAGGSLVPVNENADAGPVGPVKGAVAIPVTQSPDNAATNATSRANNAANIGKDYKINGLDANGNFSAPAAPAGAPGSAPAAGKLPPLVQSYVDSIGKYQTGEGTALQRLPPGIKSQVLAGLQDQYPGYNPADFAGIQKTVGSMASGPMGNAVRSINVVQTHLDTLQQLTQAMSNGDVQAINKLRNLWQTQTGQTAPTNLTAARQLVSGEIANVVASGGATLGDRQTAEAALNNASSPDQFAGVIGSVIKPMMAGKLSGLEQQYEAGTMGRKDFRTKYLSPAATASLGSLPGGAGGATAPAVSGIDPNAIKAELAKRGVK